MVFAASTTIAIVQPGDLGDDEIASSDTSSSTTSSTSSTTSTTASTTTTADTTSTTGGTSSTVDVGQAGTSSSTTAPSSTSTTSTTSSTTSTTVAGDTTSTTAGSGLGANGSGTVRPDGDPIADTGHESMLAVGLGLLGAAYVARRAATRPDQT